MSTSPYSLDLRKKVITQVESGKSQVSVSKSFDINLSTVSRWWLRYKREGNFLAKPRPGARSKISVEELKSYISKHPNSRLENMSKEFGISIWGIYYWLKKLGYSYKKKAFIYVEANEERREEYLAKLSTLNLASLVYIDESGIELTICKDRSWSLKGQATKAKKSGKYCQRTNIMRPSQ